MTLFGFFKKQPSSKKTLQSLQDKPYQASATNAIYNLLFCDDLELYRSRAQPPYFYPFDILFADNPAETDMQRLIDDPTVDIRVRILAINKQRALGYDQTRKELFAVIVEVGLEGGLDVLASFKDGTARYINQSGKMIVWEQTTDARANELTADLFAKSEPVIGRIGSESQLRKQHPVAGTARISFLSTDGLNFAEEQINVLFEDAISGPALMAASRLMQYLVERSAEGNRPASSGTPTAEELYTIGVELYRKGDHKSAVDKLSEAIKAESAKFSPNSKFLSSIYCARGEVYLSVNVAILSQSDFVHALQYNPNNESALNNLGIWFAMPQFKTPDYEKSFSYFDRALSIQPARKDIQLNKACVKIQSGDKSGCDDIKRLRDEGYPNAAVALQRYC